MGIAFDRGTPHIWLTYVLPTVTAMETTRLSSKGQIVLPRSTRDAHGWKVGTEFLVVDTPEGVLLKPVKPFPETRIEDVFGMADYKGPRRSLEEMDEAVLSEAIRRARRK